MRLAAGLLTVVLLGLLFSEADARCFEPSCSGLKGLSAMGVWVHVEGKMEGLGLMKKDLETAVSATLRKKLPRLKVLKGLLLPMLAVYVGVRRVPKDITGKKSKGPMKPRTVLESPDTAEKFFALIEPSLVPRNFAEALVFVSGMVPRKSGNEFDDKRLWGRGAVFVGPPMDLRAWIEDALTAFAADWYKANHGK